MRAAACRRRLRAPRRSRGHSGRSAAPSRAPAPAGGRATAGDLLAQRGAQCGSAGTPTPHGSVAAPTPDGRPGAVQAPMPGGRQAMREARELALVARQRIGGPGQAKCRMVETLAMGVDRIAHWATFQSMKDVARCRVVHGGARSALATNRASAAVGNPCPARSLDGRRRCPEGVHRLPCPRGDCLLRWPLDGPHETRSPRGAGRPRRATGCSAAVSSQERQSVSDPRGLPARPVIPQLAGVCP